MVLISAVGSAQWSIQFVDWDKKLWKKNDWGVSTMYLFNMVSTVAVCSQYQPIEFHSFYWLRWDTFWSFYCVKCIWWKKNIGGISICLISMVSTVAVCSSDRPIGFHSIIKMIYIFSFLLCICWCAIAKI